jgi:hypothetical protein
VAGLIFQSLNRSELDKLLQAYDFLKKTARPSGLHNQAFKQRLVMYAAW